MKSNNTNEMRTAISGLLIAIVVMLSVIREPKFLLQPRIWAEEGVVHLSSVIENGFWNSIFLPHLGYFSLFNNYVASAGLYFLRLEGVAHFTTFTSLLVTWLVVTAPIYLPSRYWDTEFKTILIVLFSLVAGSGEIWLNTINVQFYFGLFSSFVLLSEVQKMNCRKFGLVLFLMINAALTGITSVVLLPFFAWKYWSQKVWTWREISILSVLLIGLLVQFFSLLYLSLTSDISRFDLANLKHFPYGVFDNISSFVSFGNNYFRLLLLLLLLFPFVFAYFLGNLRKIAGPAIIAFYLSIVFAFFALNMTGGGRYGYVAAVMMFVFLLNSGPRYRQGLGVMHSSVIAMIFMGSFIQYFKTSGVYDPSWISYSMDNAVLGPSGKIEINLFPQWKGTNWKLLVSPEEFEKFK